MSAALLAGLLVGACSSSSHFIADNLPVWAGGLPEGTPPRPGDPGYEGYKKALSAPKNPAAAPSTAATSPKSNDAIDDPIH